MIFSAPRRAAKPINTGGIERCRVSYCGNRRVLLLTIRDSTLLRTEKHTIGTLGENADEQAVHQLCGPRDGNG